MKRSVTITYISAEERQQRATLTYAGQIPVGVVQRLFLWLQGEEDATLANRAKCKVTVLVVLPGKTD